MKKYTVEFVNKQSGEVVEKHRTNDYVACVKRIKMHDQSGAMYMMYYESHLRVFDNIKNEYVDEEEVEETFLARRWER